MVSVAMMLELSLLYNISWNAVGEEANVDAPSCNRITKISTSMYCSWMLYEPYKNEKKKAKLWAEIRNKTIYQIF